MQASPAPDGLLLTQSHYIESILHKANMHNSKPCSTPLAVGLQLSQHEGEPMSDPILYRQIVGALQYATITRPNICFAVNRVSQFMHSPREPHWAAVKLYGICEAAGRTIHEKFKDLILIFIRFAEKKYIPLPGCLKSIDCWLGWNTYY